MATFSDLEEFARTENESFGTGVERALEVLDGHLDEDWVHGALRDQRLWRETPRPRGPGAVLWQVLFKLGAPISLFDSLTVAALADPDVTRGRQWSDLVLMSQGRRPLLDRLLDIIESGEDTKALRAARLLRYAETPVPDWYFDRSATYPIVDEGMTSAEVAPLLIAIRGTSPSFVEAARDIFDLHELLEKADTSEPAQRLVEEMRGSPQHQRLVDELTAPIPYAVRVAMASGGDEIQTLSLDADPRTWARRAARIHAEAGRMMRSPLMRLRICGVTHLQHHAHGLDDLGAMMDALLSEPDISHQRQYSDPILGRYDHDLVRIMLLAKYEHGDVAVRRRVANALYGLSFDRASAQKREQCDREGAVWRGVDADE